MVHCIRNLQFISDTNYGLLFEGPKNASGTKQNISFNWRGRGTTPLFMEGQTGNVGIGTVSPATKLDINGAVSIGDDNAEALVWFKRNKSDGSSATVVGNSIVFKRPFFEGDDDVKRSIFAHEAMHVRQQKKYGTGGEVALYIGKKYSDPNANWTCGQAGRPTPCGELERAIESYNGDPITSWKWKLK